MSDGTVDTVESIRQALRLSSMQESAMKFSEQDASKAFLTCNNNTTSESQVTPQNPFYNSVAFNPRYRSVSVSSRPSPKMNDVAPDAFEDLKQEFMKKYGLVNPNVKISFLIPNTAAASIQETATKSFHTSIATTNKIHHSLPETSSNSNFTDQPQTSLSERVAEIASKYNYVPAQDRSNQPIRRSSSTSSPSRSRSWTDIPPQIPPREPTRASWTPDFFSFPASTISCSSTKPIFQATPSVGAANPVILPIMRDGKKASNTHYYLLTEESVST